MEADFAGDASMGALAREVGNFPGIAQSSICVV
jgi:hypothetical protein